MRRRIQKLTSQFKKLNLDALFVSNFYNIYYLTGFKGLSPTEREAWVLVTRKNVYFFTDGRYVSQVKSLKLKVKSLKARLISTEKSFVANLKEVVLKEGIKRLGFEAEDLKYSEYEKFDKHFKLIPTDKVILTLREVKEADEVKYVKQACRIAERCFADIVKTIRTGQTEGEVAFKIEFWLKEHGHDLAFYPIVAVGANSALPHYDTKARGRAKVKRSSSILIDLGALHQGYCSDMTRIVFVGKPSDETMSVYTTVLRAQQQVIKQLTRTTSAKKIDATPRQLITNNSLPNYLHSTGHGVGLEIHEWPKIAVNSKDHIRKNHVFTIEPGVYLEGKFGIRIEDTVWMRDRKQPEVLTKFSKKPIIVAG